MSENTNSAAAGEETAAAAPVEKTPGVGDMAKALIRDGKTNEEVLAAVKESFPDAKTSMASINWYRNKLRGDGETIPTARELKAGAKAGIKAAKEAAKAEKAEAKAAEKAAQAEAKAIEKAEKKEAADKVKADAKAAKASEKAAAASAKASDAAAEAGETSKDPAFLG